MNSQSKKYRLWWATGLMSVLGLLYLFSSIRSFLHDSNCRATLGILDSRYIVTTRSFLSDYDVKYSYFVDNVSYNGSDTIGDKPITQIMTVYYDPVRPKKSRLERGRGKTEILVATFFLSLAWLPVLAHRKRGISDILPSK